jgi:hypothetical protein
MPTANFTKYNAGTEALIEAINAGSDSWRVILSNTAPDAADAVQADASELTTAGGYTANGNACSVASATQSGGVYKLVLNSPSAWTGTGSGFTARYAILWNQTANALIGYWDYGSSQLVASGETLSVVLDATNGVFTVT